MLLASCPVFAWSCCSPCSPRCSAPAWRRPVATRRTGAGFTLKSAGRGKVTLAGLHFRSPVGEESCPPKAVPVKVLGSYALKQFHRGGYTAWGIGKNIGGEPGDMAAKLVVGGKTVNGSFHLLWNYADPSAILGGSAEFGECRVEFLGGKPK